MLISRRSCVRSGCPRLTALSHRACDWVEMSASGATAKITGWPSGRKVFGCRPSQVARVGMGRCTETAQARTRGAPVRRGYGDLRICCDCISGAVIAGWDLLGTAGGKSAVWVRHEGAATAADRVIGRAHRGRGPGDSRRHVTPHWPKPHGFDGRSRLIAPGHDMMVPAKHARWQRARRGG